MTVTSQPRKWNDNGHLKDLRRKSSDWVGEGSWHEKGMEVRNSRVIGQPWGIQFARMECANL